MFTYTVALIRDAAGAPQRLFISHKPPATAEVLFQSRDHAEARQMARQFARDLAPPRLFRSPPVKETAHA